MALRGGQKGNQNASKPKPITETMARELYANDGKKLRMLARSLIARAMESDTRAAVEILDRIEGKVPQSITGANGSPLLVTVVGGLPELGPESEG